MNKICRGCSKTIGTKSVTCDNCIKYYHPSCTTLTAVRNTHNITINACCSCIAVANTNSHKRDSNTNSHKRYSSANSHKSDSNTNSHKRVSISEKDNNRKDKDNNEHPTVNNSSTEPINNSSTEPTVSNSRTPVPTSSSDPLQQILEKLTILESLDKRFTEMQASFDTRYTDLQSSFDMRFTEVKTTLNTRLDEVSSRMTNLEGSLAPLDDLKLLSTRLSAAEDAITQVQTAQADLRR